jgi:hypothetical protein
VSRIRKTFYLQFCKGTPEGNEFAGWIQNPKILEHQINQSNRKIFQKKYVWYLKSVKEPNIRMEAIRRNLRARLKILKKISDCQINQSKRKFSQKNYVYYLKSVKEPKIRMGATRRNLRAWPKILKKISEHQINQPKRKFSQKKYV